MVEDFAISFLFDLRQSRIENARHIFIAPGALDFQDNARLFRTGSRIEDNIGIAVARFDILLSADLKCTSNAR